MLHQRHDRAREGNHDRRAEASERPVRSRPEEGGPPIRTAERQAGSAHDDAAAGPGRVVVQAGSTIARLARRPPRNTRRILMRRGIALHAANPSGLPARCVIAGRARSVHAATFESP